MMKKNLYSVSKGQRFNALFKFCNSGEHRQNISYWNLSVTNETFVFNITLDKLWCDSTKKVFQIGRHVYPTQHNQVL